MEHSFHGDLSKNEFYGVIEEATQKWFSWLGGPILQCQQKDARAEVYLGQNEDCSLEESTSDSSEKLLQRGTGEGQYICDFGEGRVHAIKHIFFPEGFC